MVSAIYSNRLDLTPEERLAHHRRQQKEWREQNTERVKALRLKHSARPEIQARRRQWAAENREAVNARRRERDRLKRQQSRQGAAAAATATLEPVAPGAELP